MIYVYFCELQFHLVTRVGYALDVIAKMIAWTLLMTPLEQVSLLMTIGRSVGNFSVFSVNH